MTTGASALPVVSATLIMAGSLWLASLAGTVTAMAQATGAQGGRAGGNASVDGPDLFATTCQVCHGPAGIGGVGPALRGAKFTVGYVRKAMSEGRPGTMMPEFTATFTAAEIAEVARYVAELQSPSGPAQIGLRGRPAAGQSVFFMRGSARSCSVCHSIEGRGGNVGPDLKGRIARMSAREIFQKIIVVPHRSSDPAYQIVKLTTRTGTILTGIKSGETEDTVLFYDTSTLPPALRTIPKSDIVESAARQGTVMPDDYASRLTLQQLLDVVAFLRSASGDRNPSVTLSDVIN